MDTYILIIISIIAALFYGITNKYAVKLLPQKQTSLFFSNTVSCFATIITLLIWGGFETVSFFTVLIALLYGLCSMLNVIFLLKAINIGSWAYTTVLVSLSTLIPSVSGWIFWGEPVLWGQIVGVVLLVVSFFLSVNFDKNDKSKLSFNWLICVLISFVSVGLIGVLQKIHQTSLYAREDSELLIIAFAFSFITSSILLIVEHLKNKRIKENTCKEEKSINKVYVIAIILLLSRGVFECVSNKLNLNLTALMDSAVLFPLLNGSNLVLTALLGVILFKEKLSLKQWIGMLIGFISLLFICGLFT